MSQPKTIIEGDVIPLLYNDERIDAEVYKINKDKILLRHEKWEWIDKNSNRLFPTDDMVKNQNIDDDSDDDDLYFALNQENISSNDEENYANDNKYEKKNKKLTMIYKFANDIENETDKQQNNNNIYDDHVTTEEVFACIKILKKIKKQPQILLTPLFNPIHSYLRQLSDVTNASSSQLLESLQLNKKQKMQDLRINDNKLKMKSGIRIAREERANKSEQFRQTLEKEYITNAIENTESHVDSDGDIIVNKNKINEITDEIKDDDGDTNIAVLTMDNDNITNDKKSEKITLTDMERELIEVHGQTLTTCTAKELEEVIKFIKMNVSAAKTTPFEKGTIIRDSDGTQRLDLCKQQLGPRNTELISNAMKENDKISALLLGANGIGNNGAKAVADLIKANHKNLSTIFLGCNLIKNDGIKALTESLYNNKNVRGLWLKRNPLGISGSKYIGNMLRNNTYLRTLDLVSTGLEEEGLLNVINGLVDNCKHSQLERIYLGALNIHNVSFINKSLSKMFITCINLKEIFLSTNNIGDFGAIELSKIMLIAPQIEILSLKSCNIGDDGAISLAWIITSHPSLKYLDLGYAVNTKPIGGKPNKISDRGATVFAQALSIILCKNKNDKSVSKFQRLSLASNNISDIGARSLLSALQNANKNNNCQMLHLSLDRNIRIKNSLILQYISQICKQNMKWNDSKNKKKVENDKLENDDDDDDIKMDENIVTNTNIGVSNELRDERIVQQQIYTNLGEIRFQNNVKNPNDLSGAEYDSLSIRSVYRNPKEKQFCPRLVKDGDNNGQILDKLSIEEIYQCHGSGIDALCNSNNKNKNNKNNKNINENIVDTEMNDISKFVGNKNIRKRPNKKNKNRNNINNSMRSNDNEPVRFDRYESHNSAVEPAPKLSPDQRLPRAFGVNDNNNNKNDKSNINVENDRLNFSRKCYVCKRLFCRQHFFYDSMCTDCGDYNFYQRFDCHSCENKVAIVTGARIKIGYEIALKLLRAQCFVIVTTRFPRYAAIKYAKEKDFKSWQNKLCILGLDFCRLNSVDKFIKYIKSKFKHIDILINNAATTVRRTPEFYKDIIEIEKKKLPPNIPKNLVIQYEHFTDSHQVAPPLAIDNNNNNTKAIEYKSEEKQKEENIINKVLGDLGEYDEHSQPIDLRTENSWTATLGSIHPVEMMETIMVNQFVPFLFINQLIPLLSNKKQIRNVNKNNNNRNNNDRQYNQSENIWKEINSSIRNKYVQRSYVINVSAMEGRFHFFKQGTHPHTNMAKAALNMLTRTSSLKLAKQHNIFMVSVDTGWVTDELPLKRRIKSQIFQRKEQQLLNVNDENDESKSTNKNDFIFHPPLDEIDGAARVLHPIWSGCRGKPYCGVFLKDYRRIDW